MPLFHVDELSKPAVSNSSYLELSAQAVTRAQEDAPSARPV